MIKDIGIDGLGVGIKKEQSKPTQEVFQSYIDEYPEKIGQVSELMPGFYLYGLSCEMKHGKAEITPDYRPTESTRSR